MTTSPHEAMNRISVDWQGRLRSIVETMREMSEHTDPQAMVSDYGKRMEGLYRRDGFIALSRRGLDAPWYRITRSYRWTEEINPWREKHRLPLLNSGILGDLIYAESPTIIGDLSVADDDPAREHLEGIRSLVTLPVWDEGVVRNMTVLMRSEPNAFSPEDLPEMVWMAALFGRAAQNLVLRQDLQQAYDAVDRELKAVADIQRTLLPPQLPQISTMELAAHYQTARHAGGDYYDFFRMPDGRWGFLIADVSGHGVAAAVLMAITHSLAHTTCAGQGGPAKMLGYLNEQLHNLYTSQNGLFVTAFCGAYDAESRSLTYSSAGHNPPRVKRCSDGSVFSLSEARSFPLGIVPEAAYEEATLALTPGDQIIFYTDGVTEAMNSEREMFGVARLDEVLENCAISAEGLIHATLDALGRFTDNRPADDDRTMLVARIT